MLCKVQNYANNYRDLAIAVCCVLGAARGVLRVVLLGICCVLLGAFELSALCYWVFCWGIAWFSDGFVKQLIICFC